MTEAAPLLSLRLSVDYRNKTGVLRDVFMELRQGEILGLVGQSGSGKSTLSLAILRLLHLKGGTARGNLLFKGEDLSAPLSIRSSVSARNSAKPGALTLTEREKNVPPQFALRWRTSVSRTTAIFCAAAHPN